jgi:hypothetical protein
MYLQFHSCLTAQLLSGLILMEQGDVAILPPEYHGEKNGKKILAYRTFGLDLLDFLKEIGFETVVDFSKYADQKNGIFDSYAFVS